MALASAIQGKPCHQCGTFADLPFGCHKCGEAFCEDHRLFANHDCRGHFDKQVPECPVCGQLVPMAHDQDPNQVISTHIEKGCPREGKTVSEQAQRLNFCSFKDCNTNEHILIRCKACGNSYCVRHRLQEDHECCRLLEEQRRRARKFEAEAKQKAKTGPKTQGLMHGQAFSNTQQTAAGLTSVAQEDRRTHPVYFAPEIGMPPCYMFFNHKWVVGKVVDQVCSQAKIRNDNNRLREEEQYRLFNLKLCVPLPGNVTLLSLEPELQPGDPLMLARGLELSQDVIDEVQAALRSSPILLRNGNGQKKTDCMVS